MEYNSEQIAHEEEVLEEQLIAGDQAPRYNDENVEVDEGNEQYFMEESGIIDVGEMPAQQQQFVQQTQPAPAQQHYYPAPSQPVRTYPTPRNVSYLQPQQPAYSNQTQRPHSSSYAVRQESSSTSRGSFGGQQGYGGGHQYYTVVPATSSFVRQPQPTYTAPVAHIAVNSQSETRLREVNYREQTVQKPIIRTGVVQNASSLTPTPRKQDRREVLSGSALQGSPLTTYLNFARMTKPRKASKKRPCNCTKSMCLKLYCECFANGEFCLDCNCKDCHNNLENEAERSRAIKASLQRNPNAFKPKIGVASKGADKKDLERLHQKGCHCKKSNCLKNYCECYEAKVPCTDRCKCTSCRNTEADRSQKFKDKFSATGLAQLAAAAAADARAASPFSDDDEEAFAAEAIDPKTLPWNYLDVIEATTLCLVSKAHDAEGKVTDEQLEHLILQEFGAALHKMLDVAGTPAGNNSLPTPGLQPYV